MKHDLNELKRMLLEMVQLNKLQLPAGLATELGISGEQIVATDAQAMPVHDPHAGVPVVSHGSPIVVHAPEEAREAEVREMEEQTLSLENMERELIQKALKKHRGRRRDAARELGISERTLYRKIKQYELE